MRLSHAADTAIAALAAARATRFVTRDVLGEWAVVAPLRGWAEEREPGDVFGEHAQGPRHRAVTGLDCPHCAGTWLSGACLVSLALARAAGPRALAAWRMAAGTLALSYVVGHVSARID